ncbi:inorganic diphosphatase [Aureitalea marina]|uniref:inorganic diphosphatase n=1 Tax=Aureitalea marina TaxID=930804 RepID=A0A2S7KLT5_9FLAO|nr:inorganic diphosphatase [Aureitalea marina]PQB03596.1 hypothetical protein BST85_00790 [Aureitalea marina]
MAFLLVNLSCSEQIDPEQIPVQTENGNYNSIIEIPAGTNLKIEYDKTSKRFIPDQRNGEDRVIDYLPYPANYGFIASTKSAIAQGGDGDALDVLVLCTSLSTGTVIETIPIGVLKLIDEGEQDYKILAIPAKVSDRTIQSETLEELRAKYPQLLEIIESWFLNYDQDETRSQGWGDQKQAIEIIDRSRVN